MAENGEVGDENSNISPTYSWILAAKGDRHTGIERNTLRAGFDYFWVERREFGLLRLEAGSLASMH